MAVKRLLQITLENFQSHKYTVIGFSDGVTTLTGESSNGKTAVLRGLQWVFTNRPMGVGFISHWAKGKNSKGDVVVTGKCCVSLKLEDMEGNIHVISRERSANTNCYIVDGEKLDAVGSDVPKVVSDILGMKDVNFQSQDDSYFMLCMSPGQVSAKLNGLVHLDTIDEAYGFLRRRKMETNVLLKEANYALARANVNIDALKHVPQLWKDLDNAAELREELDELFDKWSTLFGAKQDLTRCLELLADIGMLPPESALSRMHEMVEIYDEHSELCKELNEMATALGELVRVLSLIPSVRVSDELHTLVREKSRLEGVLTGLSRMGESIRSTDEELELVDEGIEGIKPQLPEVCPLCGGPVGGCGHV